jgi:PAS domain S-box-containing protein
LSLPIGEFFITLFIFISFLFMSGLFYRKYVDRYPRLVHSKIMLGAASGILGILLIVFKICIGPHMIIDLRHIAVVISALFGGIPSAVLTAALISIGRISIYGFNNDSIAASINVILTAIIMGAFHKTKLPHFYIFLWMNIIGLIGLSVMLLLSLYDNPVLLIQALRNHWIISLLGGSIIYFILEFILKSNRDFFELKLQETQYRQLFTRYERVIKQIDEVIFQVDLAWEWIVLNPAWTTITGYSLEETAHLKFEELVHPLDKESWRQLMGSFLQSEEDSLTYEIRILTKDNQTKWLEIKMGFTKDENAHNPSIIGTMNDITVNNRLKEELEFNSFKLKSLIDHVQSGVIFVETYTQSLIVNESFLKMFNIPTNPVHFKDIEPYFRDHSKLFHLTDKHWTSFEAKQPILNEEFILTDGTMISRDYVPVVYSQDSMGHLWNYRDVTIQKKTEIALKRNELFLQSLMSLPPLAYYVVNYETDDILYFNANFCTIWGLEGFEQDMRNRKVKNTDIIRNCLQSIMNVSTFIEASKPLQDQHNQSTIEDEIGFKDGRIIRWYSTPLIDDKELGFGRLHIFEDITSKKLMQEQLQAETSRRVILEERERLFREIHDNTAQVLFFLNVSLVEGNLDDAMIAVKEIDQNLRQTIFNLRSSPKEVISFQQKMNKWTLEWSLATGIEVSRIFGVPDHFFKENEEIQLFLIIQEAFTNIRKHSQASHVELNFHIFKDTWKFIIRDNGRGIDESSFTNENFGIFIMYRRALDIGVSLNIQRHDAGGTELIVQGGNNYNE